MKKLYKFNWTKAILPFLFIFFTSNIHAQSFITIGTGTSVNTNTGYPSPYANYYWGNKNQFIIPASEIISAGGAAGAISSLAFNVGTVQGTALNGYEIKIGTTSLTSASATFTIGLTSVYTSTSYTEVAGWNTHNFSTPFFWDGVSNLVIETCFNNSGYTYNAGVYYANTAYSSTVYVKADNATVCGNTSGTTVSMRPNIKLGITMGAPVQKDLGVMSWDTPSSSCGMSSTESVTIRVKNYGSATQSSYSLKYTINGGTSWATQPMTTPILAGDTLIHTFSTTADFSSAGNYNCQAVVILANDSNSFNDTLNTIITSVSGVGIPYFTDIESWATGVVPAVGNNWTSSTTYWNVDAGGTPSSTTGPSLDHTLGTAVGNYVFLETSSGALGSISYLTSPCVDFGSTTIVNMKFWYHMYGATMGTLEVEQRVSGAWVSTGWSKTGQQQSSETDAWAEAIISINPLADGIRFKAIRGSSYSGDLAIDDISFSAPQANDLGVLSFVSPNMNNSISPTTSMPISIEVVNAGMNNQSNFTLKYSIDGGSTFVSETYTSTLNSGDTMVYNFTQNANLINQGFYQFVAVVYLATDGYSMNDTIYAGANVCTVMNGTYTIGSTSGNDYPDLNSALSALNSCGINSPITLLLDSGTFDNSYHINSISGASSINTITIKGQGANTLLTNSNSSSANRAIFLFDGAKHIILDSLNIQRHLSSTYFHGVHFMNQADSNTVRNCTVDCGTSTSSSVNGIVSSSSAISYSSYGNNANSILIENNTIIGGYCGISFRGTSSSVLCYDNQIINNTLTNQYYYGIYFYYLDGGKISENQIIGSYSGGYAMYLSYGKNKLEVSKNTIDKSAGGYGMYLYRHNYYSPTIDSALIFNNFIHVNSTSSTSYGVYHYYSKNVKYLNNTVSISGVSNVNSRVMYIYSTSSTGIILKNNILSNTADGYAIYSTASSTDFVNDYNNLYTSGTKFCYQSGEMADITTWRTASAGGTNSVTINPDFITETDLHTNSVPMSNLGVHLSQITHDIDGELRNTSTPDIGADEYNPPANDIAITEYLGANGSSCGMTTTEAITVVVKNNGASNQTNIPIKFKVNGGSIVSETLSSLNSLAIDTFTFSATANLTAVGTHNIIVYSDLSNDENRLNDTVFASINSVQPISSFPFYEGFENSNLYFNFETNSESHADIDTIRGYNSENCVYLTGGDYTGWNYSGYDFSLNLINNSTHEAIAATCNVDATSLNGLKMSFRTYRNTSGQDYYTWFWVTVNGNIIQDISGDSVWYGSQNNYSELEFDLSTYTGSSLQISLHGLSRYHNQDDIMIDDFRLWEPQLNDVGVANITSSSQSDCGSQTDSIFLIIKNFGLLSQTNIPVALDLTYGNTYNWTKTYTDTILPGASGLIYMGMMNSTINDTIILSAYTSLSTDTILSNDSLNISGYSEVYKVIPHIDDFTSSQNEWNMNGFWIMPAGAYGLTSSALVFEEYGGGYAVAPPASQGVEVPSNINTYDYSAIYDNKHIGIVGSSSFLTFDFKFLSLSSFYDTIHFVVSPNCTDNYQTVFTIHPGNSSNYQLLQTEYISLSSYIGDNLKIGVYITSSNGSSYMIAIDNFGIMNTFTYSLGNDTTVCYGETVNLNTGLNAGDGYSFNWHGPGIGTNDTLPTLTVNTTGLYYVDVTNNSGFTVTDSINVLILPQLTATINTANNTICYGDSTSISINLSGVFPMAVNWKEGNILHIDTTTSNMSKYFNPTSNTQYTVVSVVDSFGCTIQNADSLTVEVNSLPTIALSGLASQYCSNDTVQMIQATPMGGTFMGPVNAQGAFDPQTNIGLNTIYYVYTDANTCTNIDTIQTTVYSSPIVSIISQLDSQYCSNATPVNLNSYPQGGSYSGSSGIIANQFDPSMASLGFNEIFYSFTDANNCSNIDTIETIVVSSPSVSITTVLNSTYCEDAASVSLTATPSGGNFSGMGVTANTFNPSQAGNGNIMILYGYTDNNGCTNYDTTNTIVNATPNVNIVSQLDSQYCSNATSVNLYSHPQGGTYSGSTGIVASQFDPSQASLGVNQIIYSFTDANNCSNIDTIATNVVSTPSVSITSVLSSAYCEDAASVSLTATPSGGNFSGMGVTANTFNPSQAGIGNIIILYGYTDNNGCTNYDTTNTVVNTIPTVLFTSQINSSYCQDGSAITLSGYPSGGTFAGSGVTGSVFYPNAANTGTNNLSYSFTDNNGCYNSDTVTTSVHSLPSVSFNLGSIADVCENQGAVALSGGLPTGGSYLGAAVSTSQSEFYPIVAGVGFSPIEYSYTDANGCQNADTQNIKVISVPLSNFTTPSYVCKADTASVNYNGIVGASATFQWAFDNANIISGTNSGPYQLSWDTAGVKSLSLSITDSGCTSALTYNYTNVLEAIAVATLVGNDSACFGDSILLFANSGTNYLYQWYDTSGNMTSAIDTLAYYSANQSGMYYAKVTNNYGCWANTNNIGITINSLITSDFILPSVACKNDMVNVSFNGTAGTTAIYNWDFDNGTIASGSGAGPYNIIWSNDSIKNVSLYVEENSCASSITTNFINVEATPAQITALGSTSFCDGSDVTLSANAGPYTYEWFKNGVSTSNTQAIFVANQVGTYTVEVTNNTTSCSNVSDSVVVIVNTNDFNLAFTASQTNFTIPPFNVNFTNQTPSSNDYYWMWSFGDGNTSTFVNPAQQYNYDGTYTVGVIAQNINTGCFDTLIKTDYIVCNGGNANPCSLDPSFGNIGGQYVCPGDSVKLYANDHTTGITYQWLRDGILIGGATDSTLYAQITGLYQLMLTDTSCSVFSQPFSLTLRSTLTPSILVNGNIQPCSNDSMELYVSTSFNAYQWSNGANAASIYVQNSGSFIVTVTDNNGCQTSSAPYVVNASLLQAPEICIVGIDTATNHNRIVWERQANSLIDSFKVYRESTVAGVYDMIGAVDFSTISVFEDANSNPAQMAYRYRITAIDTCGMETPPSPIHKTLHLTINAGLGGVWNLIWTNYEGFNFGSYKIYRGTDSTNLQLLTQIQSTLTSYTDLNPPTGNVYYQIEIISPNPCYPDSIYSKANTNYNSSRSNTANTNLASGTGFVQSTDNQLSMQLYPNPNKGQFVIEISNVSPQANEDYNLEVYSAMGKLIYQEQIDALRLQRKEMHFETLSKGVYIIRLRSKDNVLTSRFVIE